MFQQYATYCTNNAPTSKSGMQSSAAQSHEEKHVRTVCENDMAGTGEQFPHTVNGTSTKAMKERI